MNYRKVLLLFVVWGFFCSATYVGLAKDDSDMEVLVRSSKAFSKVAQSILPAVVFIKVEKAVSMSPYGTLPPFDSYDDLFDFFFRGTIPQQGRSRQRMIVGQGTGFIITKDGYILTNNHVVGDADQIIVRLHDGREFKAKRIGSDPHSEVALIKIEGDNFPVAPLGNSDEVEVGEWVLAIGNPFGLSETLTMGIVSAKGRSNIGITDYEDFIQTDAAINPGNSGGPLINVQGKVIGINTAIYSQTGGSLGIGFAIPINMAVAIKDQFIKKGGITRGYLGIMPQDITPELAQTFNLKETKGILIAEVIKDSPADKAGLKVGDIIIEMEGKKVTNARNFRNQIAMTAPGTSVVLKIIRDGKEMRITFVTGTLPGSETSAFGAPPQGGSSVAEKLGIKVAEITDDLMQRLGFKPKGGVVITEIEGGSLAEQAGLRVGMVILSINRKEVNSVSDFNRILSEVKTGDIVLFLIQMRQGSQFVAIKME